MSNLLATESDAASVGGKLSSSKKMCTNSRAVELGCKSISGYDSNQIVPVNKLEKAGLIPQPGTKLTMNINANGLTGSVILFNQGWSAPIPPEDMNKLLQWNVNGEDITYVVEYNSDGTITVNDLYNPGQQVRLNVGDTIWFYKTTFPLLTQSTTHKETNNTVTINMHDAP